MNKALRIATGCTQDTPIQHLHDETHILPIKEHLQLHATQLLHKSQLPTHPLHTFTKLPKPKRKQKQSIFQNNNRYATHLPTNQDLTTDATIKTNMQQTHTDIVQTYITNRQNNKILTAPAPAIHTSEQKLDRQTRRTLAQLAATTHPS